MSAPPSRHPVHTLTGFLGSGKSTLLNRLLGHQEMSESAVIVNELGDVGIDHALVETAFDDAVLMRSGCLCCTLRGDLVDTLCDLSARVQAGRLPPFERVLVETTGLADPGPVLRTLAGERLLTERYSPGLVITTVDAMHAERQHRDHEEFARQVSLADRVVITKVDLAGEAGRVQAEALVRHLNPAVRCLVAIAGDIEPARLMGAAPGDGDARTAGIERWAALAGNRQHDDDAGHRHDDGVCAYAIEHRGPVEWRRMRRWLESIVSLRGDRLLRLKGLVNVRGVEGPVVVHGVQHVLHPALRLARWPDADRRTRIVLITRDLALGDLRGALAAACSAGSGADES